MSDSNKYFKTDDKSIEFDDKDLFPNVKEWSIIKANTHAGMKKK
jgi:hypothetical protein